ncbi:hypothetical protein BDF14DRAFT_1387683 [Spinellus fusiger]|nr:hypothetical protein BDF14DRAFT_407962 [Spinellus fusiger]KAI7863223.1 hypothetical protein BDF14DRAFT_1387683 [Spinellus fusiger]
MPCFEEPPSSSHSAHSMENEDSNRVTRSMNTSRFWRDLSHTRDSLGSRSPTSLLCTPKVTDYPWTTNLPHDSTFPSMLGNQPNPTTGAQKYDLRLHSLLLCRHILTRGLMEGVGSDIQVNVPAWNKVYSLHRLILDQNPYFTVLLQGGFSESSSNSVTLCFEETPFITAESFYFVLTQLYGKLYEPTITQENVRQILATCSFFQLDQM